MRLDYLSVKMLNSVKMHGKWQVNLCINLLQPGGMWKQIN